MAEVAPVKILLVVFSGTGNTLRVANLIKECFVARGAVAEILDISRGSLTLNNPLRTGALLSHYDIIGFGYPVYAFNAPAFFLEYVRELKPRGKTAFIFKTSGEPTFPNNASSRSLIRLLKDCRILGEYHFLMPYNIVFRFPDMLVRQMYSAAKNYSASLVNDVLADKITPIHCSVIGRIVSCVFTIQRAGAFANSLLYSVDKKKCSLCGHCIKDCPSANITVKNGKFRFGRKCLMCMRCSFACPRDAIRIGFLNGWRVNGAYHFEDAKPGETFIGENSKGMWRIFIPWFQKHR